MTIGEVVTGSLYRHQSGGARRNRGDRDNVSPPTVGIYFHKINCFCFTEQRFAPGEKREMAVVFFVDPTIADDPSTAANLHHHAVLHLLPGARSRSRWRPRARQTGATSNMGSPRLAAGRDYDEMPATERTTMAEAHANRNDYHLVDPSPWPFVGSVFGLRAWRSARSPGCTHVCGRVAVFGAGVIGVLYTMVELVARHVDPRSPAPGDHTRVVQIHHRYGMILFIASEVMFFVAWFWAYFDAALFPGRQCISTCAPTLFGGVWPPKGIETFDPWHLPLLNTLILLTSGTTVTWAHHALLHGDREGLKKGLWLTIALGALFTCVQAYEYAHAAFAFNGHIYGATFFMATGFHGFHVLIGTIFLTVCLLRAYAGIHARSSISASNSPPGTGTSSTWSGCSCSSASMSGASRGRPRRPTDARRIEKRAATGRPFLFRVLGPHKYGAAFDAAFRRCDAHKVSRRRRSCGLKPSRSTETIDAAVKPFARPRLPSRAAAEGKLFAGFLTLRPPAATCAGSILRSSIPATARRCS